MVPDFRQAKTAATRLLLSQRLYSLHIDVTKLQYKQNILFDTMQNYCRITRTTLSQLLGEDASYVKDGCTFIRQRGGETYYIVLYNEDKNPRRQAFTLAHEVGHILLGHREDGDIQEAEANVFAAQLLAPDILVHTLLSRAHLPPCPEDLCAVFTLSREAAGVRLRQLPGSLDFESDDFALLAKYRHILPEEGQPVITI